MKSLNIKRLAVAALALTALCASFLWPAGTGAQTASSSKYYRLVAVTGAEGYDVQWRDDRVVGLRALRPDGSWFDLRPYVAPTDEGTAPRGVQCPGLTEVVHCYEDEENQMTVCICVDITILSAEPGEALGPVINSWQFVKKTSR